MKRDRWRTLPLGVDVGESRVRVALIRQHVDGRAELLGVATRPRAQTLAAILADAVTELRTSERRCVFGIGEPAGIVRAVRFPPMRHAELERAARFEAGRAIDYPIDEGHVRIVRLERSPSEAALGIVRKDAVAAFRSAAHAARLRIVAVDNAAFALRRALPETQAVLDIGLTQSLLYVFGEGVPRVRRMPIGGATFTRAIVDALGTDDPTAERRKVAHGIAGGGEDLRDRLAEAVANALGDARAEGDGDVRSVALVGNGSRLDELAPAIERAAAVRVRLACLSPLVSPAIPPDVLRAAAPDWCQAYGLALWAAA